MQAINDMHNSCEGTKLISMFGTVSFLKSTSIRENQFIKNYNFGNAAV